MPYTKADPDSRTPRQQCKRKVFVNSGVLGHHAPCSRDAVRDGYCTQHHPETVAGRRKARDEKWDAEMAAIDARMAHAEAAAAIVKAARAWRASWSGEALPYDLKPLVDAVDTYNTLLED